MACRLRQMNREDAHVVAALCAELGYPTTADAVRGRLDALRTRDDRSLIVAEDDEGAIIGWVHVVREEPLEAEPWAEVTGLVVTARARGRGVGRALLEAAESWALERRLHVVRVRSNVIRTEAHEFYRRLGYEVHKTQLNFRKTVVS